MRVAKFMREICLFPLRAMVFAVGLFMYWMEVAADWLIGARNRTEYVRTGGCRRCGRCCQLLGLLVPPYIMKRRFLVALIQAWHVAALNFEPVGATSEALIYRCQYYREGEGCRGCRIYPFRHRLCRFFPRQALYGRLDLHEDCGFRFMRRDVLRRRHDRAHDGKPLFEDLLSQRN